MLLYCLSGSFIFMQLHRATKSCTRKLRDHVRASSSLERSRKARRHGCTYQDKFSTLDSIQRMSMLSSCGQAMRSELSCSICKVTANNQPRTHSVVTQLETVMDAAPTIHSTGIHTKQGICRSLLRTAAAATLKPVTTSSSTILARRSHWLALSKTTSSFLLYGATSC
jgi:hypothetical protein